MSRHFCPWCGDTRLRRSRRRNLAERVLLPLFFVRPYRCSNCQSRSYGFSVRKISRNISASVIALMVLTGLFLIVGGALYLLILAAQL